VGSSVNLAFSWGAPKKATMHRVLGLDCDEEPLLAPRVQDARVGQVTSAICCFGRHKDRRRRVLWPGRKRTQNQRSRSYCAASILSSSLTGRMPAGANQEAWVWVSMTAQLLGRTTACMPLAAADSLLALPAHAGRSRLLAGSLEDFGEANCGTNCQVVRIPTMAWWEWSQLLGHADKAMSALSLRVRALPDTTLTLEEVRPIFQRYCLLLLCERWSGRVQDGSQ
jgi:hypothetical protein